MLKQSASLDIQIIPEQTKGKYKQGNLLILHEMINKPKIVGKR